MAFQRFLQCRTSFVRAFANVKTASSVGCRQKSTTDLKNPTVVLSKDGDSILCWHPEKPFPYECTKPLPRTQAEMTEGDSVIKAQYVNQYNKRYRSTGPTQQELMKIFHTTRHVFDHRPSLRLRKKNPPKDRDGI